MRDQSGIGAAAQRIVYGLRDAALGQPPALATEIVEVLSPTNPFGIKAGGEGGCTPALAVVVNATFGTLVAWLLVRDRRFLGRRFWNGIVDVPFAMSPEEWSARTRVTVKPPWSVVPPVFMGSNFFSPLPASHMQRS